MSEPETRGPKDTSLIAAEPAHRPASPMAPALLALALAAGSGFP